MLLSSPAMMSLAVD